MKKLFLVLVSTLFILETAINAQEKFATQAGHIWIYSNASEVIEGHNKTVASFLDITTGDIAFRLLVKSFKFEQALMEEHFNENYMESTTFPKSDFKGKITNLSDINFKKDGIYKTKVEGAMTIHGVTKTIQADGSLEVKGSTVKISTQIPIVPEDYKVEIPSIVRDKIAKSITVNVDMSYDPLQAPKK